MSPLPPVATIPVGIVVERRKATSPWIDFVWQAVTALPGAPEARPWSVLDGDAEAARLYAGSAEIGLYRSDTGQYRDNLMSGSPSLWVVLRASGGDPPYELFAVTANPNEGESFTEAGNDLVEPVPMPDSIRDLVAEFVAEHHVEEEPFHKRKRDRVDPEALARREVKDGKP